MIILTNITHPWGLPSTTHPRPHRGPTTGPSPPRPWREETWPPWLSWPCASVLGSLGFNAPVELVDAEALADGGWWLMTWWFDSLMMLGMVFMIENAWLMMNWWWNWWLISGELIRGGYQQWLMVNSGWSVVSDLIMVDYWFVGNRWLMNGFVSELMPDGYDDQCAGHGRSTTYCWLINWWRENVTADSYWWL